MIDPTEMTYDADRWGYRKGARFVGPREWLAGLPQHWTVLSPHMDAYTDGMATAADDDGTILDYRVNEWYEGPLSDVLRNEHDKATWTLKYDRFVAMLLTDIEYTLLGSGYLATRGNGDTTDRRLTLPA